MIDIDKYLELLTADDPEIRITAIADIITNHIPREYPEEFYDLMLRFERTHQYNRSFPGTEYQEYFSALTQLKQVSGFYLRDKLESMSIEIQSLRTQFDNLHNTLKQAVNNLNYHL